MNKNKNEFPNLPSINDYSSRKEWEDACWRKLLNSKNILQTVITPYERRNLIMRAAVMGKINSDEGHRQIARELSISRQTVSEVKKSMDENKYKSYRQRGKTDRKKKIYSSGPPTKEKKHRGRPIHTKYGTIYWPN